MSERQTLIDRIEHRMLKGWRSVKFEGAELDVILSALRASPPFSSSPPSAGEGIYVASRASLPARSAMWRDYRDQGVKIISSWIDEAGEGETADFAELWDHIMREIAGCERAVLYAEPGDFPLKGALIEAGIALGMGKPVTVCLPGVELDGRTSRPLGSWIAHRGVSRQDDIARALLRRASNE